ncbi:hypothetical protein CANINC_002671 [Pichia inconspicua]|uniref:Rhodanese domain-containing protein n=1 Tax=Pichia inconspicua TaxID=52247 RepID=A0A4T0X0N9_9ASCO|nr:hypothetical protein CANINC_002671 [[Candida] inconspicua]
MSGNDTVLSREEYSRYGRQMQVPVFNSLNGQINLKIAKVLVIGCGGLGSSALLYLGAAGIGTIGLLDHDKVEISNLHRQIIHDTSTIGMFKTESAAKRLTAINPHLKINIHSEFLSTENCISIVEQYDLVLDCTDSPATKYLISDTCILLNKILVTASSVQTDGQLMILNYNNGPCYRCINPVPTNPENIATCSDNGVIGPCVGLVGTLMSIETIKIITGYYNTESNNFKPIMLMYSGYTGNNGQSLKTFKMRNKQSNCICNSMTEEMIKSTNYNLFCGEIDYNVIDEEKMLSFENVSVEDDLILDVRPQEQFQISNLSDNHDLALINIPYKSLIRMDDEKLKTLLPVNKRIVSVCKMGNDSRLATKFLSSRGYNAFDMRGGLNSYSKKHDFNIYW